MRHGILCRLSDLNEDCKKQWPIYTVAGGALCILIGRCVVRHINREKVQRKIRERKAQADKRNNELQNQIKKENVDSKIVMMSFNELQSRLQDGSLTAEEVWKSYMAKALEVHEKANALTDYIPSGRAEAQALDRMDGKEKGLLHGIPISVKEATGIKGMDATSGLAALIDHVRTEDSILIQVLKSHGAVPFIKTNLAQALSSIATDNPIFGLTVNPLNTKRSPGGSSGGEGAMIGGGGSILGIGSDIGGSVRIPAAFCGFPALKPTRGRYSYRGSYRTGQPIDGESIVGVTEGPMGRDVNALVQFMRAACSQEMFDLDPSIPPVLFRNEIYKDKRSLRIGYYTYDGCSHCVPSVLRGVTVAKETLEKLGHTVVPFEPFDIFEGLKGWFWPAVLGDNYVSYYNIMNYDDTCDAVYPFVKFNQLPRFVRWCMGKLRELTTIDPVGVSCLKRKNTRTLHDVWRMNTESSDYKASFIKKWKDENIDVVICPVIPCPAFTLGLDRTILAYTTYTSIFNLVNFPAGTVPVTRVTKEDVARTKDPKYFKPETTFEHMIFKDTENSEDLPIAIQIAGLPFHEEMVLRVMSELENAV